MSIAIAAEDKTRMRRLALASALGNTLEWYDFTIYNLMAAMIFNAIFFPSYDPLTGTILAFSTYTVGYLSRPLGGIIFGQMGDKKGRKFVLIFGLVLMGMATALMGLLPPYASLGILSPILLVMLRFLQGVAVGGVWSGAVLLTMESGATSNRGKNASFTQIGPSAGTLFGAGILALVTTLCSPEQFQDWGWRIPFLVSVLLVLLGLWLRGSVDETPVFREMEAKNAQAKAPVGEVFTLHWRRLLIAGGSRIGCDIYYALVVLFTLTYVTTVLHLPRPLALTATMLGATGNAFVIPLFGALSDKFGRRFISIAGAILAIIWSFAYFWLMDSSQTAQIVLAVFAGLLIHAIMYGVQSAFVTEQFPTRVRNAGSSLAYTLAGILGGGFAPLIITTLFKETGTTFWVSIYVSGGLAVTILALFVARETAHKPLED